MRYTTAVQSEKLNFRQRAVVLMKEKRLLPGLLRSNDETPEHAYELEVHQIEMELQIEALFQERSVALDTSNKYKVAAEIYKDACEKYTELYDFAPSGHFTLSREGEIIELNFSGSQMLGKERLFLKNRRFGIFVSNDTKPIFNHFLTRVFHSKAKETCKVILTINDNLPMYVYLTGIANENREQCVVNVVDITGLRQEEQELIKAKEKSEEKDRFKSA